VSDSRVEEQRFSDGDIASDCDADQAVGTDRLKAEVHGDYRRTEHPVTCTHANTPHSTHGMQTEAPSSVSEYNVR